MNINKFQQRKNIQRKLRTCETPLRNSNLLKKNENKRSKQNRKRNIIYFNPPNNNAIKTKIGIVFFKIFEKRFAKHKILKTSGKI